MLLIVVFAAVSWCAWAQTADLLLVNGTVHTVNPQQPSAREVAVRGDRILAVGDDLTRYAGPQTQRIDLRGASVTPGLIDSHVHMRNLGSLLESKDLRHVKTVAAVAAYVREEAARRPKSEWITGRAWDETNWGGTFPTAKDLDAAAPEHPVSLTRVDGHASWVNHAALALAGITKETPDPPGGRILRDAQGDATGILVDRAQGLVRAKIPAPGDPQVRRWLTLAAKECARLGLTSVHDAGVGKQDLDAYRALYREGSLPVRVYAMIGGTGALWQEYLKRGPEVGDWLTVRAIKLVADGALGSRGAALWQDYSDEKNNTGLSILSRQEIEAVARAAADRGFQVATHAIGDRANRVTLDAYAAALGGRNDKRFRIEHAQVVSLPDFARFRDFSVIASVQATHATSDMRWARDRLGPDRLAGAYAWRRFLSLGIPLANGSDFPVEEPDPMLGFYASVTRQDLAGNPPGGWMPDQRLTREEALRSWTLAGAWAAFEEREKGSLEPGKVADLVVLNNNILSAEPSKLPGTRVIMTVLGGKIVYQE